MERAVYSNWGPSHTQLHDSHLVRRRGLPGNFIQRISGETVSDGEVRYEPGEVFAELENSCRDTRTLRIDSQLIAAEGSNADALRGGCQHYRHKGRAW